ncbi:protein EMBRYONIC FLOWER 1-like isoform X2 [Mangifera indica]|uniref:protein EMBRYONIC FLOWER 1-like isoform X2 n=1 Tax=Mangifera indica TaxID=29780 RepID=UPI001CFAF4BE|nr:protein EMBRYONIC FLOWER 1-like isoform X2 [Mangifera indica]
MVEENHHTSNSDLVSKSVGSSIKIDSISIDLVSNNEIDAGNCEHFSIRGYVSEIRKKNWKICWPFALDSNHDKFEEQACTLPPLPVSKFRWWHCQNCLQEFGAESIKDNNGNTFNYCSKAIFKSGGTCSHMSSLAQVQQSDFHQGPKLKILESTIVDASTAIKLNDNDCHPSSCNDKKEKKSESANTLVIEHEMGSEDNTNLDVPESAGAATGRTSGMMTARSHHTDDTALKASCNGSVELHQPSHGSCQNAEVEELADKNLKSIAKNSSEICETGKQPSAEVEQLKAVVSCGTSGVNRMVNEVIDAVKSTSKHPCRVFDEYDDASSESAGILPGNDPEDHHDNSSGSHRKKTRKVRLLTELLAKNGDASMNLTRDEKFSSNSAPDASAEVAAPSTPHCSVAIRGNVLRVSDQNRKRKFSRDEEWRPLELSCQNNFHKRDRTCNEGVETVSQLASADSEEDAGTGLQIGVKSHLSKFRLVRSPTMSKKKNKKGQAVDEFLSLAVPAQENVQKECQNEAGDVNKVSFADIVLSESGHTTFTSRGMHPFPLPPQKTERNSSLCKKKSKMPLCNDRQASLIPWSNGLLRGSPLTTKDMEIMQMPSFTDPFQSTKDVCTEKGSHLSLKSCLSSHGYDRNYISPLEDQLLLWQEAVSKENQVMGKDIQANYVIGSYFASKSEPEAYQRKVNGDLSSNTFRTSFLNDKQKSTSQSETGNCSLMQQMDFCGRNSNLKSTETMEHSALPKKHYDQRADKASEQGIIDDIPMEIVELMAKNQYERCLPDIKNDNHQSETTINTGNAQINAKGKFNFLLEETAHKPKPQAKSRKSDKVTRIGSTKKKSVDCFSQVNREQHNIQQLEPGNAPTEFRAFPQCQERLPSGVRFSDTSFCKHGMSQNCQWIGNILGHRSYPTNLQTLGSSNTCQSGPQQNKEGAHLWSAMMPSHMPFVYNIGQKHADPSSNINSLSHYPNSLCKGNLNGNLGLNFLNLNSTNNEKHNRNSDSENLSRTQAECPLACKHSRMGSLDLYSNETIPAMHLLSLMDAGLQSGAPIDINGTQKFHKRPSFVHDHPSKDFFGLSSGGYKTSSTMKPPLYDYYGQTSLRSKEKEKTKGSDSPSKNKSHRSQKSVLITGGLSANHRSFPFNMQKNFLGTSVSMAFPLQCQVVENASKCKSEACNTTSGVLPLKSSSKTEICSINRNPADFSTPEAGNVYMIRGEDLKFRKPVFPDNRSGLIKLDRRKRQRKLTAAKGKV